MLLLITALVIITYYFISHQGPPLRLWYHYYLFLSLLLGLSLLEYYYLLLQVDYYIFITFWSTIINFNYYILSLAVVIFNNDFNLISVLKPILPFLFNLLFTWHDELKSSQTWITPPPKKWWRSSLTQLTLGQSQIFSHSHLLKSILKSSQLYSVFECLIRWPSVSFLSLRINNSKAIIHS